MQIYFNFFLINLFVSLLLNLNYIIMNKNLIELESLLMSQRLTFIEMNTRMNYGMIGHLNKGGESLVIIYEGSFYVSDKNLAINKCMLRIIELIRLEFSEVSRDNNGRITPITLGVEMQKEGK